MMITIIKLATAIFSRILTAVVIIVMLLFSSSGLVQILPVTGQSNVNVSSNLTGTNLTNSNASNASLVSPGNITKLGKDNQTAEETKPTEDQKTTESKESTDKGNKVNTETTSEINQEEQAEKCIPDPDNPSSCESEKVSPSQSTKNESEIPVPKKGDPPTANAGPDIVLRHGNETKKLDGTASSDPDGLIVSYNWRLQESQDGCPSLVLNDDDKSVATIINGPDIPTKNCNYNYQLKIRDDTGLEDNDSVRVKVECLPALNSGNLPPCEDEIQKEQKSEPTTALKLKSNFKVIVQVVNRYNGSKSPSDFTVHITTSPGRHAIPDTFRGVDAPGQPVLFSGPVDNRTGPELYTVDGWAPGTVYSSPPEFIGQCGATSSRAYDVPPPPGEAYCKIIIRDTDFLAPRSLEETQGGIKKTPANNVPQPLMNNISNESSAAAVAGRSNETQQTNTRQGQFGSVCNQNPLAVSPEIVKPTLTISDIDVPEGLFEYKPATIYFILENNDKNSQLTGNIIGNEGQRVPVNLPAGETLYGNIGITLPIAGYYPHFSIWYYDNCNSRNDVVANYALGVTGHFSIRLDKIYVPEGGTAAVYRDDDVFSLSYRVVPPSSLCDLRLCPATPTKVITDIGSPRHVPPPGTSPILSTGPISLIPGDPRTNLYFVILIVNAGENQAVVSRNIDGAGGYVLNYCREPSCSVDSIYQSVDQKVFSGGDKGGCDATVVIGKEKISPEMLIEAVNSGSITQTKSQSLVNHGDCARLFAEVQHPAEYQYTWTVSYLPS